MGVLRYVELENSHKYAATVKYIVRFDAIFKDTSQESNIYL